MKPLRLSYSLLLLIAVTSLAFTVSAQTNTNTNQSELQQKQLEIEKARMEGDLRLREEDLKIKRDELQVRKEEVEGTGFFKFNAATGTIAVALIGLLGTAVVALINYRAQTRAEKSKFESDLILKAIETGDTTASTRNLLFLLKAGFIRDPDGTINALASDADSVAVLPPRAFTSGPFQGIPPEGVGGDPDLNILKNRDRPPRQYSPMTVEQVISLPVFEKAELKGFRRSQWPLETLEKIAAIESGGAIVEGYLNRVWVGGRTSATAHRQGVQNSDWLLSLTSNPEDDASKSVTTVISPRTRSNHPDWTLAQLQALSRSRQRVRVSGWLLFGQPMLTNLGRAATRWRIQPILEVEVQGKKGWISLSDSTRR
jgi:hypothetical protein